MNDHHLLPVYRDAISGQRMVTIDDLVNTINVLAHSYKNLAGIAAEQGKTTAEHMCQGADEALAAVRDQLVNLIVVPDNPAELEPTPPTDGGVPNRPRKPWWQRWLRG